MLAQYSAVMGGGNSRIKPQQLQALYEIIGAEPGRMVLLFDDVVSQAVISIWRNLRFSQRIPGGELLVSSWLVECCRTLPTSSM